MIWVVNSAPSLVIRFLHKRVAKGRMSICTSPSHHAMFVSASSRYSSISHLGSHTHRSRVLIITSVVFCRPLVLCNRNSPQWMNRVSRSTVLCDFSLPFVDHKTPAEKSCGKLQNKCFFPPYIVRNICGSIRLLLTLLISRDL